MNRYWFKPKRYGFGATPATWEGWAATAVVVLCILIEMQTIPPHFVDVDKGHGIAALAQVATVAVFLLLCRLKTDGGWRWRWGGKD